MVIDLIFSISNSQDLKKMNTEGQVFLCAFKIPLSYFFLYLLHFETLIFVQMAINTREAFIWYLNTWTMI
uniref:Uncharacterized protein n=1 Tax=Nymphaea colorata TaxID=210225 RepID=A0A5K0ZL97_9MAGN